MIDTVIFDIGNVLAQWHWQKNFAEMFDADKIDAIADATVRSPKWLEMDRGVLSEEEMIALFTKDAPQYAKELEQVVRRNHTFVTTYPYADDWLKTLKAAGYRVYILSNFGDFSYNRAKEQFSFLQYADGALISYEVKLVKPDHAIYRALCEKFSIVPENAVFLDDNAANTAAAEAFGLHAITVENKAQADAALRALGVHYSAV